MIIHFIKYLIFRHRGLAYLLRSFVLWTCLNGNKCSSNNNGGARYVSTLTFVSLRVVFLQPPRIYGRIKRKKTIIFFLFRFFSCFYYLCFNFYFFVFLLFLFLLFSYYHYFYCSLSLSLLLFWVVFFSYFLSFSVTFIVFS